jgi:histone-lysine N-methyltransferase SETD8|uniref:SET domain-containing protein n=1 Tax=Panagrolaimus sp. PS1159 TaxID=55785 RepID=A0AC35F785_9BILA
MDKKTLQKPSRGIEDFCYRRSTRKTTTVLKKERETDILWKIQHTEENEKDLLIEEFPEKGRGIRATKNYDKNDFVCEYKGEIISMKEAHKRENQYALDPTIGSYMYFFIWKGRHYCVDATKDSPFKGRLINHSYLNPNLRTHVVQDAKGKPHLCLFALRSIKPHDELLYDYGDHSAESIAGNPWILTS